MSFSHDLLIKSITASARILYHDIFSSLNGNSVCRDVACVSSTLHATCKGRIFLCKYEERNILLCSLPSAQVLWSSQ